jgi:hypothetical protein
MRLALVLATLLACGGGRAPTPEKPITAADLQPDPDGGPPMVDSGYFAPYRISGTLFILPPDSVMRALRDSHARLHGRYKYCVDEQGLVMQVSTVETSSVAEYDTHVESELKKWRFKPIPVDGRPTAVCTIVTFVAAAH